MLAEAGKSSVWIDCRRERVASYVSGGCTFLMSFSRTDDWFSLAEFKFLEHHEKVEDIPMGLREFQQVCKNLQLRA